MHAQSLRPKSYTSIAAKRKGVLLALPLLLLCASGCAVHYSDYKSGAEHLWGFGKLRLQSQTSGAGLVSVSSGYWVPGLCLELGRSQFGFTFGYVNRQQLALVGTNVLAGLERPTS